MKEICLKYLCTSFSTSLSQQDILEEGSYRVFGASGLVGYMNSFVCNKPYLGIIKDGAGVGRINIYEKNTSLLGTMAYIVPNKDIDIKWLKYAIISLDLGKDVGRTTIPHIYFSDYGNKKIVFVSAERQKIIASYLEKKCSEIDSVIEKTKATIEEYKKLKQSVITEAVTKGIRGDRKMKDSGIEWIGKIPADWNVIKATRIINTTQNGLTRRDLEKSDGKIVLKLKNITPDGQIDYSEVNRINLTEREIDTYRLEDGDFLFVRVNGSKSLVGKCAIYQELSEPVAYNDHIIRVCLNELCNKHYFQWYLMSNVGKTEIDLHTSTAAGQYTISGDGLRDLFVVLPTHTEQTEIADYLDKKCAEVDVLIAKKTALIDELESYKKSVIYEYVTGKKEVH